jgi:hypothetical protein
MFRKAIAPAHFFAGLLTVWCSIGGSARAQDEYATLFNGEDLSGWIAVGTPGAFDVRENSIYCTGAGPYPSWLHTEKEYENFILRFEYQTQGWYEGGVLLHAPLDGPKATVMVNGEEVCETDKLQPPYKGSIAFQQHTPNAVIRYRGARIRPLQKY